MSFITRGATYSRAGIGGALVALAVTMFAGTATAAVAGTAPHVTSQTTTTHAAHVTGSVGPARGKHLTHAALTPRLPGGTAGGSTATSTNWDGYVALNPSNTNTSTFTHVSAQWTEPTVTCDPNNSEFAAFWTGFDGWQNGSVEQGGTYALCNGTTPSYAVWWEMFPFNAIEFAFSINAGDVIQSSVTFDPVASDFDIQVKDVTSGQTLNQVEACQADQAGCVRSSAEVISEDVGGGAGLDGVDPLPNYGTNTYTGVSLTNTSGHTGTLSDSAWNNVAVTQVSSQGVTKQTVGPLSTDGSSFTTTWKAEFGTQTAPPVVAEYLTNNTSATTNQLSPQIELVNTGTASVPLSSLTVRYWFTEDGAGTLNYACDFVPIGCTNLTGSFVAVNPAVTGADHYLQIGFGAGAGSLGPNGGSTGGIQGRIFQSTFANMTQTNDYSFNAADTSFTANPHITVYFNGALIYGTEP